MERTPYTKAEVEKLITEKNAVGSKKSRLEGTRIFSLVSTLTMLLRVVLTYFHFLLNYRIFVNTGYVRSALEEWLPLQKEFDQFASRLSEKRSAQTVSTTDSSGGKSKNTR